MRGTSSPVEAFIVALPESAGSALYGMVDVLAVTGTLWQELTGGEARAPPIRPRLVSTTRTPFRCGHGIPVEPDATIDDVTAPAIVIVTELWLAPDDDLSDRHEDLKAWLRACHAGGTALYSACTGAILLAAAGLLDGREATSHWGYEDLFRRAFPAVRFNPAPALCIGDPAGRIVTAGGTSSWHDLALHVIARHASPGAALEIAKVYLMKWHAEGQLPFAPLVKRTAHADSAVRRAQGWLADHHGESDPVAGAVAASGIAERSLKRRFRAATGITLIAYCQNLRIEAAKRLLETGDDPVDAVAEAVGYNNHAFFRRVFRRSTGVSPGTYRRMFAPVRVAADGSSRTRTADRPRAAPDRPEAR